MLCYYTLLTLVTHTKPTAEIFPDLLLFFAAYFVNPTLFMF